MGRLNKPAPPLTDLPFRDEESGDYTVVVETPKASQNKYKYDPQSRALRLGAVLSEGLAFPYDFGFIPATRGDDGDPIDVLLFLDHGVPPSTVLSARMIGVLEVRQRTVNERKWKRNDRFLAVATHAHGYRHLTTLTDLRPHLLEEIETFFSTYARLSGKQLQVLSRKGRRRAETLIGDAAKRFERERSSGG